MVLGFIRQGLLDRPVGNNMDNNSDDVIRVKDALGRLGYLERQKELHGIIDRPMDIAVKKFQKDNDLTVDGYLNPGGETEKALIDTMRARIPLPGRKPNSVIKTQNINPIVPTRKPQILSKVPEEEIKQFIRGFEGEAPHFYKDSNGYVTIGVGQKIVDVESAKTLPFYLYEKDKLVRPATKEEIVIAFTEVNAMKKGHKVPYYRPDEKNMLPNLRLKKDDIDTMYTRSLHYAAQDLKKRYPDLDDLPPEAQKAMLDIMFNVGMTEFKRDNWKKLFSALDQKDWMTAARESSRETDHIDRNQAVKNLFESIQQRQGKER